MKNAIDIALFVVGAVTTMVGFFNLDMLWRKNQDEVLRQKRVADSYFAQWVISIGILILIGIGFLLRAIF